MDGEIELVSDGESLILYGDPTDIEAFIEARSLPPSRPAPPRLQKLLGATGAAGTASGRVAAESGRWLELTEKSALDLKNGAGGGLTPTGVPGISHAMLGQRGDIKSWLQVVDPSHRKFVNPATLASAGALMTQLAMRQAMDEIKDYLAAIEEKVDDVLRAQKDAVLAEMIGVGLVIDEAMTIREHTGHVSEVTWSKIQAGPQTLASAQAYALRQLDALVEKVEAKGKIGELADAVQAAEPKAREWLAVIARSFQLQDAIAVLELDRVFDSGIGDLDEHRLGLRAARQRRLDMITRTTDQLLDRLGAALGVSNAKILFHPAAATGIARSGTRATEAVVTVQQLLGIESDRQPFESTEWKGAAKQLVRSARDAGTEGLDGARQIGGRARGAALTRGDRLAAAYSRKSSEWRARSSDSAETPAIDRAPSTE